MTTDAPDWKALGDLLVTRRVQLDPRHKNRRKFVADTHSGSFDSWYRMVTSIETGGRDNYSRETLAAMEVAYQLEPGSLSTSLHTSRLVPAKQKVMVARSAGSAAAAQAPPPPEVERTVLDALRAEAEATAKSIGDILVERGLASPDELTLSDAKQHDPIVKEILESDLSEETKNSILMAYVEQRRGHFRRSGVE